MNERDYFSPSLAGYGVSILSAIPIALFAGVGGALIAACAGCVAATIVNVVSSRLYEASRRALEGSQQLEGVLDSSQLGGNRRAERTGSTPSFRRLVSIVISLIVTLVASGVIALATNGEGIGPHLTDVLPLTAPDEPATQQSSSKTSSPAYIPYRESPAYESTTEEDYYYEYEYTSDEVEDDSTSSETAEPDGEYASDENSWGDETTGESPEGTDDSQEMSQQDASDQALTPEGNRDGEVLPTEDTDTTQESIPAPLEGESTSEAETPVEEPTYDSDTSSGY